SANKHTRAIRNVVIAALFPAHAPPAEPPVCPGCKRAELAAEKKRADDAEREREAVRAVMGRHADEFVERGNQLATTPAKLDEANEEIARLKRELDASVEYHADFAKRIEGALGSDALDDCDGPRLERLEASIGILRADFDAEKKRTTAKLGRTVAALREARVWLGYV